MSIDYYDNKAELVVELWSEIENMLIEDIARRIRKSLTITETAKFQLFQLEQSNLLTDYAVKIIAKKSGQSEFMVQQMIKSVGLTVVKENNAIYRQAAAAGQLTFDVLPLDKSPMLQNTIQSCIDNAEFGLSNLTNTRMMDAGEDIETLTNAARREYYDAVNRGFLALRSGAMNTEEATKSACMNLAKHGIRLTHWESGHTDTVEVAVRRNLKTSMAQTSAKMTIEQMKMYKSDLVIVTSHWGARPSHAVWQGQIYSLSGSNGYADFYDATEYGTLLGLCGVNCRHRFYPYFPGTSNPMVQYDEEENKKQYLETQEQRAYERAIRAEKRKLAALNGMGASDADIKAARGKIRQKQADLRQFLDNHPNLTRDRSREQIYDENGTVK